MDRESGIEMEVEGYMQRKNSKGYHNNRYFRTSGQYLRYWTDKNSYIQNEKESETYNIAQVSEITCNASSRSFVLFFMNGAFKLELKAHSNEHFFEWSELLKAKKSLYSRDELLSDLNLRRVSFRTKTFQSLMVLDEKDQNRFILDRLDDIFETVDEEKAQKVREDPSLLIRSCQVCVEELISTCEECTLEIEVRDPRIIAHCRAFMRRYLSILKGRISLEILAVLTPSRGLSHASGASAKNLEILGESSLCIAIGFMERVHELKKYDFIPKDFEATLSSTVFSTGELVSALVTLALMRTDAMFDNTAHMAPVHRAARIRDFQFIASNSLLLLVDIPSQQLLTMLMSKLTTSQLIAFADLLCSISFEDYDERACVAHIAACEHVATFFKSACIDIDNKRIVVRPNDAGVATEAAVSVAENSAATAVAGADAESSSKLQLAPKQLFLPLPEDAVAALRFACDESVRRATVSVVLASDHGIHRLCDSLFVETVPGWVGGQLCAAVVERLDVWLLAISPQIPRRYQPVLCAELAQFCVYTYLSCLAKRYQSHKKVRLSGKGMKQLDADLEMMKVWICKICNNAFSYDEGASNIQVIGTSVNVNNGADTPSGRAGGGVVDSLGATAASAIADPNVIRAATSSTSSASAVSPSSVSSTSAAAGVTLMPAAAALAGEEVALLDALLHVHSCTESEVLRHLARLCEHLQGAHMDAVYDLSRLVLKFRSDFSASSRRRVLAIFVEYCLELQAMSLAWSCPAASSSASSSTGRSKVVSVTNKQKQVRTLDIEMYSSKSNITDSSNSNAENSSIAGNSHTNGSSSYRHSSVQQQPPRRGGAAPGRPNIQAGRVSTRCIFELLCPQSGGGGGDSKNVKGRGIFCTGTKWDLERLSENELVECRLVIANQATRSFSIMHGVGHDVGHGDGSGGRGGVSSGEQPVSNVAAFVVANANSDAGAGAGAGAASPAAGTAASGRSRLAATPGVPERLPSALTSKPFKSVPVSTAVAREDVAESIVGSGEHGSGSGGGGGGADDAPLANTVAVAGISSKSTNPFGEDFELEMEEQKKLGGEEEAALRGEGRENETKNDSERSAVAVTAPAAFTSAVIEELATMSLSEITSQSGINAKSPTDDGDTMPQDKEKPIPPPPLPYPRKPKFSSPLSASASGAARDKGSSSDCRKNKHKHKHMSSDKQDEHVSSVVDSNSADAGLETREAAASTAMTATPALETAEYGIAGDGKRAAAAATSIRSPRPPQPPPPPPPLPPPLLSAEPSDGGDATTVATACAATDNIDYAVEHGSSDSVCGGDSSVESGGSCDLIDDGDGRSSRGDSDASADWTGVYGNMARQSYPTAATAATPASVSAASVAMPHQSTPEAVEGRSGAPVSSAATATSVIAADAASLSSSTPDRSVAAAVAISTPIQAVEVTAVPAATAAIVVASGRPVPPPKPPRRPSATASSISTATESSTYSTAKS